MRMINADITTIENGVIIHQVNCLGVMGAGVARAIRNKWPKAYYEYKAFVVGRNDTPLGLTNLVEINDQLYVANFFGQDGIGGKQDTDYTAWEIGLPYLKNMLESNEKTKLLPIYFPYLIGCGLGGGDWDIILKMILNTFKEPIFCKWP